MSKQEAVNAETRLKILIEIIEKEFPFDKIASEEEITVTRQKKMAKKRDHRITFSPCEDLLTDQDSDFIERFNEGIRMARRILDNPPFEDKIYQGDVVLKNDSVTFEPRKE